MNRPVLYRMACFAGLLTLAVGATFVLATVEPAERNAKLVEYEVDAFGSRTLPAFTFVGKQKATVVWIGNKTSAAHLGVYVYDAHGNCVANDDFITPRASKNDKYPNAVAVEWVPPKTASYTVELVNLSGISTEKSEFTAK